MFATATRTFAPGAPNRVLLRHARSHVSHGTHGFGGAVQNLQPLVISMPYLLKEASPPKLFNQNSPHLDIAGPCGLGEQSCNANSTLDNLIRLQKEIGGIGVGQKVAIIWCYQNLHSYTTHASWNSSWNGFQRDWDETAPRTQKTTEKNTTRPSSFVTPISLLPCNLRKLTCCRRDLAGLLLYSSTQDIEYQYDRVCT